MAASYSFFAKWLLPSAFSWARLAAACSGGGSTGSRSACNHVSCADVRIQPCPKGRDWQAGQRRGQARVQTRTENLWKAQQGARLQVHCTSMPSRHQRTTVRHPCVVASCQTQSERAKGCSSPNIPCMECFSPQQTGRPPQPPCHPSWLPSLVAPALQPRCQQRWLGGKQVRVSQTPSTAERAPNHLARQLSVPSCLPPKGAIGAFSTSEQ